MQQKSSNIRTQLWKKIGKSNGSDQKESSLKSIVRSSSEYSDIARSQMNSHMFVHSPTVRQSDEQSMQNKLQTSKKFLKSSNEEILEEINRCGVQVKNVDDSSIGRSQQDESYIERDPEGQDNMGSSQFYRYDRQFRNNFLHQPNIKSSMQSASIGLEIQSSQLSPLPPLLLQPSLNNWSSHNISKILSKIKTCHDKLYVTSIQVKKSRELMDHFYTQLNKFMAEKQDEFEKTFMLRKSSKSIESYLKQSQQIMIAEVNESRENCITADIIEVGSEQGKSQLMEVDKEQPYLLSKKTPNFKNLQQQLKQKQLEIESLQQQLHCQTQQYLEYKNLFAKANNDLNHQLDEMVEKLKIQEEKYIQLFGEFVKLKEAVDARGSMVNNSIGNNGNGNGNGRNSLVGRESGKNSIMINSMKISRKDSRVKTQQLNNLSGQISESKQINIISDNSRLRQAQLQILNYKKQLQSSQLQIKRLQLLIDEKNLQVQSVSQQLSTRNEDIKYVEQQLAIVSEQLHKKEEQFNQLRNQYEQNPSELPEFRKVGSFCEKQVNRAFSFGTEGTVKEVVIAIGNEQPLKDTPLTNTHNLKVSQQIEKIEEKSKSNLQELIKLKQSKLKEYQLYIQKMTQKQAELIKEKNKLSKQLQKVLKLNQKIIIMEKQLKQAKVSLQNMSKRKLQLQESNQKLDEYIFDLQQRTVKAENQYSQFMVQYNYQIKQLRVKLSQTQSLYSQLLQKVQNKPVIVSTMQQLPSGHSLSSLPNLKQNQTLINQVNVYKKLYEQKQVQLQQEKSKNHDKLNEFVISQEIQRQTDKYRIEALKQDLLLQQDIINRLSKEKQQLVQTIKSQTQELMDKSYMIEKLNLEIKKIKLQTQNININTKNPLYSSLTCPLPKNNSKTQISNVDLLPNNITLKEKQLMARQQQLHALQLKLQTQQRMLQLTKKEISAEYQKLLMKHSQMKSQRQEEMNKMSFEHLNASMGVTDFTEARHNHIIENSNIPKSSNLNSAHLCCNPKNNVSSEEQKLKANTNNSMQAEKILNALRSKNLSPTSDRYVLGAVKRQFSRQRIISPTRRSQASIQANNIYVNQVLNSIRANSPRVIRMTGNTSPSKRIQLMSPRSPRTRQSPNKDSHSQSKKLKIKIIEQKMKKLKAQVKDSLKFAIK